jgi:thiol:disulfide interchange protein
LDAGFDAIFRADATCTGDVDWNRERLSRIMRVTAERSLVMYRRLAGNGMRVVAASAVLAAGAVMGAAPVAFAQSAPIPHAHIFPDVEAAHTDIQAALIKARAEHKRVLLDFGGDWCGDCQVLNYYMHQSPNKELLEKYYVLVDVNIGHIDQNIDIGDKYGVVLKKGVPAMAVLRPDGTVVYGQKNGEFENMRNMQSSDLTTFLEAWKPQH